MRVSELMTPVPVRVTHDTPVGVCAARMDHLGIRHLPVVGADGRLVGMVTDAGVHRVGTMFGDAFITYDSRDEQKTAADIAVTAEVVVGEEADLSSVLRDLARTRQDCVVIVDAGRAPIGILTEHDMLKLAISIVPADLTIDKLPARPLVSLVAEAPAAWALDAMTRLGVRHVVVVDETGKLVGVVSHRDLVADDVMRRKVPVLDVVRSPNVVTVAPAARVVDCATRMLDQRIGCLPVVVGDRALRIVSRRDAIDAAATALESEDLFGG